MKIDVFCHIMPMKYKEARFKVLPQDDVERISIESLPAIFDLEYRFEIMDKFDDDKKFHLNFAMEVTAFCDCTGTIQPVIVNDIGVLCSKDIIAVDTATLDLIAKEGLIENNIPPFFRHANLDPKAKLHPFQRLHGPFKDPYLVIDFAEKLGLGSRKYKLIEVMSANEMMKVKPPEQVYERQPSFF